MAEETGSVPTAGVAMTAIGVAMIRVRESRRRDRLYDDPLAQAFVDAARAGFDDDRWARFEALADQFYEARSVAVRLVDDDVVEGVAAGCEQIVLLGAGLDTRAFRLGLAPGVRFFELDLPELFAFKEPLLAARDARPTCERRVIAADLRDDWANALRESGFHADHPTQWIDEGVLGYLSREQAYAVAATVTELSATGSRFGVGRFQTDTAATSYRALRDLVSGDGDRPVPINGLGPDAETWLAAHGWRTTFRAWDELAAPYARPVAMNDPQAGNILAIRE
ncbi:SAM-dependent methyltransferase [Nocardia cyriacigeorgica]|uniref:SAM-dependent methyltransferase n=1 Tax=Nocardia cyriacigeorgica TaxID=135487 RepID=UPI001E3355D2|nr:SAM-dependent methyltransferase [Nocardia cyriacigeorgica]